MLSISFPNFCSCTFYILLLIPTLFSPLLLVKMRKIVIKYSVIFVIVREVLFIINVGTYYQNNKNDINFGIID